MANRMFNILGSINPGLPNEPKTIDISLIDADQDNFYAADRDKENKRVELLAEEIMEVGFRSVIEVRPVGNRYTVIAGETRLSAMKLAYEKTKDPQYQFIPCYIQDQNEISNRRRLIMDNLLQRELTPALKMQAIEELQKTYQEEKAAGKKLPGRITYLIAQDIGLGKTQVGTYQTVINHGTQAVKEALQNEEISLESAAKLSTLSQEEQEEFVNEADEMSREAVNQYVDRKKTQDEDVYETTIYDFIDDDDDDEFEDEYDADQDEQFDLSDHDKALLADVLEHLDYTNELRCAKTRLKSMNNTYIADQVKDSIDEVIELFMRIQEFLS